MLMIIYKTILYGQFIIAPTTFFSAIKLISIPKLHEIQESLLQASIPFCDTLKIPLILGYFHSISS